MSPPGSLQTHAAQALLNCAYNTITEQRFQQGSARSGGGLRTSGNSLSFTCKVRCVFGTDELRLLCLRLLYALFNAEMSRVVQDVHC